MSRAIRAVITDLDNSLFRLDEQEEPKLYAEAARKALAEKGLTYTFQEALQMTLDSYRTLGHDLEVFVQKHQLDRTELQEAFYRHAQYEMAALFASGVQSSNALSMFEPDRIVVLTNSPRVWAAPVVLERLNFAGVIHESHILSPDHEEIGGEKKKKSEKPFRVAQKYLGGLPFNQILMIDDKDENLKIAAELGMLTARVTWSDEPVQTEPFVSFQGRDVNSILNLVMRV